MDKEQTQDLLIGLPSLDRYSSDKFQWIVKEQLTKFINSASTVIVANSYTGYGRDNVPDGLYINFLVKPSVLEDVSDVDFEGAMEIVDK